MTSSNSQAWNMKQISLNNLGSKHSLLIIFTSLCNIAKEKFLSKNYTKNETWKLIKNLRKPVCRFE